MNDVFKYLGIIFTIACLILPIVFCITYDYADPHYETITVTEKTLNPRQGDNYLIFTESEVYCITDQLWFGKFNSSDIYNSIKVGETYEVYVSGERHPFFSTYKNIVKIKE